MADVFISYKREEREKARAVAEAVARKGYTVWWDVDLLSGERFAKEIETVLRKAKAAIVLWSEKSIQSHWVLEEAELARSLDIIVPVLLDDILPPFGFRNLNSENLSAWTGDARAPELERLMLAVERKAGPPPQAEPVSDRAVDDVVSAFHVEAAFWASIAQSGTQRIEEYQAYLTRFGDNAQFADLARARIERLKGARPIEEAGKALKWAGAGLAALAAMATIYAVVTQSGGKTPAQKDQEEIATPHPSSTPEVEPVTAPVVQSTPIPQPTRTPDRYAVGSTFTDCTGCPEMVVLPAGRFMMGSNDGANDEKPVHEVTIDYKFAVGKFEITWAQWEACVNAGGCDGAGPESTGGDNGWGKGNRPVINVDWNDAQAYARWLSGKTGHSYRLLSEAEWEYAARAGTTTRYSWGDNQNGGCRFSNGADMAAKREDSSWTTSTCDDGYGKKTAPVGSFQANAFGLYDMHGNVWEWTQDCWNNSYSGAPSTGAAWEAGDCSRRVLRGGSSNSYPFWLRSALRFWDDSTYRVDIIGFRLARTL